ncbi:ATP :tRNA-specific tRNA nucleotidyltransferase [Aspergillus ambiguus]|uniref:tRNA adenylyltransferase n=1 Tax=Aspergillus ambiguus TaxID=176160 RepID=UPI003CCD55F1
MTIHLTPIENTLRSLLLDVAEYIREQEIAAGRRDEDIQPTVLRFTGGWVRDKLLGVGSQDIDVAINTMTGYQFGMRLKEYLDNPKNLEKYRTNHNGEMSEAIVSLHKIEANPEKSKHLETVTTKIFGLDIDLVNLRKETYTDDSRNPQMEFGTAEEDAMRRDATINALFYNLNESKVEDLTGRGFDDMRDRIIRTPLEPYQTFKDDPLRVLRLIRFASRLGYRIDEETENAMQNSDISVALKLKISRERVGTELEKMLRGPDPRGALHFIDRLGLYPTIFTNYQDDVCCETASWSLAYNAMERLLHDDTSAIELARTRLICDSSEPYYAWVITALAPWSNVPTRILEGPKAKPLPPRSAEVARDSLRSDNKTITVLGDASKNWEAIISVKSSLLQGTMKGTAAEIRQRIGLCLRAWKKDWRLCIILSILQEIMQGGEFAQVIDEYNKFLSYIVDNDLQDVCTMKPIVNGGEIMKSMGVRNGPWMGKAMEEVIQWQLLHPDITEKQKEIARDALKRRNATTVSIADSRLSSISVPTGLDQLWEYISLRENGSNMETCEHLLVTRDFIRLRGPEPLSDSEEVAVNHLYEWASGVALPSSLMRDEQLKSNLSLSVIFILVDLAPLKDVANASDVVLALASFTSENDPWTTPESCSSSTQLLNTFNTTPSFWTSIEKILKDTIRPIFGKTRNPAVTAAGRKNFHPVPLARFDTSILDPESKPWKVSDVYATTVLSWIIRQYRPEYKSSLEAHTPLLVPSILALIDDDNTAFKTRGCSILLDLLTPIRESNSDILQRTNLSSVFEDAIRPCLLSLPTITPEDEAINLLSAAYPALLSLLKLNFLNTSERSSTSLQEAKQIYIAGLTKTLRENLISSFHHISSTSTTSSSPIASFPYPRLSTLLLEHITAVILELGIHTTKYLQDLIPLVHTTLSNPFGPAYPPLLFASISVTRAVILNAHPRLWRWRGEVIGALCSCFLNIVDEGEEVAVREKQPGSSESATVHDTMGRLMKELKGAFYLLRFALENPLQADGEAGQLDAKDNITKEVDELVAADDTLKDLLMADVDTNDGSYFGIGS